MGVTGTNGKTTTTCLIKDLLERVLGTKAGLIGTIENQIGSLRLPAHRTTPESCEVQQLLRQMADAGCTHVVMEVSSHALVQHRVEGLTFDVGVFTNLTQDHLDYHHTMEEYREAKGLLFRQCETAVLNLDDEAGRWYRERVPCPVFTYSENKDAADLTAKNIRLFPGHVEFEAGVQTGHSAHPPAHPRGLHHLQRPGRRLLRAVPGAGAGGDCRRPALCPGGEGGGWRWFPPPPPTRCSSTMPTVPTPWRMCSSPPGTLRRGGWSACSAAAATGTGPSGPLMGAVVRELADVAVVTSDNPRTEDPWAILEDILAGMGGPGGEIHIEPDRPQAIRWALAQGRPGDVIVLAGKGHETYQEVNGVQYPMDEREIVAEYFEKQAKRRERAGNFPAGVV